MIVPDFRKVALGTFATGVGLAGLSVVLSALAAETIARRVRVWLGPGG